MPASLPASALPLPVKGQVQVWLLEEVVLAEQAEQFFAGWLNDEERQRWQRYRMADDRQRFLQARALVRGVLARYCQCDPAVLQFARDAHGKPYLLPHTPELASLRFNLSHTRGLCALAVTVDVEVGVDVENQTREVDMLALAERYFARQEVDQLKALSAASRRAGFFRLWTLKEAYVKARGLGLRLGLGTFAFSIDDKSTLLAGDDASHWSFCSRTHAGNFQLAVAANAAAMDISLALATLPVAG